MGALKIGTRLIAGFSVVLLLLLALTFLAVNRMGVVDNNLQQIVEIDARKLQLAIGLRDLVRDQSLAIRDVVMQDDISFKKSELKRMKDVAKQYAKIRSDLQSGFSDLQTQQALQRLEPLEIALKTALDAVIEHSLNQDNAAAGEAVRSQFRPAQLALVAALDKQIDTIQSDSANSAQTASVTQRLGHVVGPGGSGGGSWGHHGLPDHSQHCALAACRRGGGRAHCGQRPDRPAPARHPR